MEVKKRQHQGCHPEGLSSASMGSIWTGWFSPVTFLEGQALWREPVVPTLCRNLTTDGLEGRSTMCREQDRHRGCGDQQRSYH